MTISDDWPDQTTRPGARIDLEYLRPLVDRQVGDVPLEAMVSRISNKQYTITTLLAQVEDWVTNGFRLGHDGSLTGKHHHSNYKSALEFKSGVTKSLLKRLDTSKTVGPFAWTQDMSDIPMPDCAVNPIGAVRYKYEHDRARACDDPFINTAIDPPGFTMDAMDRLRAAAFPGCSWLKSDVASAFPCMNLCQEDLPWMLFAWYHPDDTDFTGTDQDCLCLHTHGNFGPRPFPHHFTMLMLLVNVAAKSLGLELPAAFIDDNIHTGKIMELRQMAPRYWEHMLRSGLKDKEAKREFVLLRGDLLGVWFDSIRMTLSIPQDKLKRLSDTITGHLQSKKASYAELSHLLGYWEFCVTVLPKFMKGFMHSLNVARNALRQLSKDKHRWLSKRAVHDLTTILELVPLVNNTVAIRPRDGRTRSEPCCTDASGGSKAAAAWVTPSEYQHWSFSGRRKKEIIAILEGDAVEQYLSDKAADLAGSIAPMYIDNTVFLYALRKGHSKT